MTLAIALFLALGQAPETPATPAAPATTRATEETPAAPAAEETPAASPTYAVTPAPAAPVPPASRWYDTLSVSGFARVGLFYALPLRDEQLVGSNGGFRVADFRLGLDFRPVEKVAIVTSVELSAPLVDPADPLTGRRILDLRDAYVEYDGCRFAQVRAGQFRPPYDAEMLISDASIPFTSRSVLATGLGPPEGYGPRTGLAPDRQVGLEVGSARLGRKDSVGVRYALGVFNGNGVNQLFNDNNGVMPVGRVELDWAHLVTVGVNASYNSVTQGERPNRLSANHLSYGADVAFSVWRVELLGAFLGRATTFSYAGLNAESAMGILGQARYFAPKRGIEAAVRFAVYEPSSAQEDDQVTEIAAMVGWRPFELPFRVLLQYTHREEEARVALANDSVDLMLHATW